MRLARSAKGIVHRMLDGNERMYHDGEELTYITACHVALLDYKELDVASTYITCIWCATGTRR